jgi:hypothetical protein
MYSFQLDIAGGDTGMTDDEMRRLIDRRLPHSMNDADWGLLVDEGYLDELRSIDEPAETLANAAQHLMRVWRHHEESTEPHQRRAPVTAPDPDPQAAGDVPLPREVALAKVMAIRAAQEDGVRSFRHEILADRLLAAGMYRGAVYADEWIEQQWQQEMATLDSHDTEGDPLPILVFAHWPPDGKGVSKLRVAPGGVLDRLRQVAEHLATTYHWELAVAAVFVLVPIVPVIKTLTVQVNPRQDIPALTRVTMTIDPALTPTEVADAYRKVRRQVVAKFPREIDEQFLWLAVFVTGRPAGETYSDQMAVWNEWFPQWAYGDVQKFGRDYRRALQRLLQSPYQRPSERNGSTDDYTSYHDTEKA